MRLTFAAVPAYGHVLPMLPLAAAAAAAGHQVDFGASDAFDGHLPVPVFSIVPEGMTLRDAEEQARAEVTDFSDPMAWPTAMFGKVMPRLVSPRLLAHWDRSGTPDAVIHEASNIGAALAAREAGVPCLAFNVALAPVSVFIDALRRAVDYPLDVLIDPRPDRWLAAERSPYRRIPIRSVGWSDPRSVRPAWLDTPPSGRTAYLTLGTVAFGAVEILRRSILETAARCDRVLVAAGPDWDVAALGELPSHVHVERFVDQPAVLERVDVAVHHGGTGTVLGCLAAGVPQVITPQGADQFLNAARLQELGAGYAVSNDAPAGSVGSAVDRMLADAAMLARVGELRDDIARMPSPHDVLATVAEYAATHPRPRPTAG